MRPNYVVADLRAALAALVAIMGDQDERDELTEEEKAALQHARLVLENSQ